MELLYALAVSLFIGPDANRLGADDWHTREAAHDRLKLWGWLARPTLKRVEATTDNPEVLHRVRELVRGRDGWVKRFHLATVLACDVWPEEGYWTDSNRWLVFHAMRELKIDQRWYGEGSWAIGSPWRIRPDLDCYECPGRECPTVHERCNQAVCTIRRKLGVYTVAPHPRAK